MLCKRRGPQTCNSINTNLLNLSWRIKWLLFEECEQKKKKKNGERKVQGLPQSQTAALPRHDQEEETDKTKQAQMEQTYEKH